MTGRRAGARGSPTVLRLIQLLFGAGCVAVALPLIFQLGWAAAVANATSVRVLGAAFLALALGAFSAARDPLGHLVILRMEILFTALTATFLTFRIVDNHASDGRAWVVLLSVVACLVLLLACYPRRGDTRLA